MSDTDIIVCPERPEEPDLALGYYECLVDDGDIAAGDLVYLLSVGPERVEFVSGERRFTTARADFAANYRFAPDGAARRQAQIAELMAANATEQIDLSRINPHLGESGEVQGMELLDPSRSSALETKKSVAAIRNLASRKRSELEARQAQIKALAEEQALILRAQTTALAEVLSKAEEAVWTINLYLGTNEEIVRLAEGAPAPADEPIAVRQLVLYMDEESRVAADAGGLDFTNIDVFDEWLTADPAHLEQVLPERKGMVALKPRRTSKRYSDNALVDARLNEANRKTYFLLRNGDNVYRMWTDYEVGERLVPKTDEFVSTFVERRYNFSTGRDETINLRPGSEAFMRAEKSADGLRRHYMRAALILQGLLDRTPVFHPLPDGLKIDVTQQSAYEGPIRVILDADGLLSDGVERFTDWMARINGALDVGMRVVGSFNNWEYGLRNYDYERRYGNERISPNGAGYPSSDAIYTIEGRRNDGFVIYFERDGERWDRYEGFVGYAKRASCVIYPYDKFILNFDAATISEMEYYLTSRLDRHNYMYLVPVLRRAIELKQAEAAAEAPFAQLLAARIVSTHGVDVETATAAVPELISWWKFANRTHRALTSDDAKALRMIVAEFGHRAAAAAERNKRAGQLEAVRDAILAAEPNVLLIAHKTGAEYVALIPANDENVFVHEQTWTARGRKSERTWRTVDARHQRWEILHTSARWADWKVGAARNEHLTDDERAELISEGWDELTTRAKRSYHYDGFDPVPLAAAVTNDGELQLFYVDSAAAKPATLLLSSKIDAPDLGSAKIKWRRDAKRRPTIEHLETHHLVVGPERLPWIRTYNDRPYGGRLLWSDAGAINEFVDELRIVAGIESAERKLRNQVGAIFSDLQRQANEAEEAAEYAKFLADYGDPDLWEGHRKTLKLGASFRDTGPIHSALSALVERHIDPAGMSVAQVAERAAAETGNTYKIPEALADLVVPAAEDEDDD